ncbi:MAG: anaerobic ribonucleoside-triphosphate reductase activating protein [Clostridia bacterium]|nr:anaerobic ribonucleoside-triphosphate reductase activating protein [Clostridia bacterium]
MTIMGLQKLTLLDFPGKIACTVFTGGCNFRCPFCHNASLVIPSKLGAAMPTEDFFDFLKKRQGILGGVCVSGGEPTLMFDLEDFLTRIKSMGFLVKLDTNGSRPEVLRSLVEKGLIDYVAMDIKNSPDMYPKTVGVEGFDVAPILESAEYLMSGAVEFEFRTTLVEGHHTEREIRLIGEWLRGAPRYYLQNFVDSGDLILEETSGLDKNTSETLLKVLKTYIPNAEIRGI